jgi:hypothetical protein
MGLGGISFWMVAVFLVVAGALVALVIAALAKYVFGLGKSSQNPS